MYFCVTLGVEDHVLILIHYAENVVVGVEVAKTHWQISTVYGQQTNVADVDSGSRGDATYLVVGSRSDVAQHHQIAGDGGCVQNNICSVGHTHRHTTCGVAVAVVESVGVGIPPDTVFLTYITVAICVVVSAGEKILDETHCGSLVV